MPQSWIQRENWEFETHSRTRRRNHDGGATRTGGFVKADRIVGGIRRHLSEGAIDRLDQRDASRRETILAWHRRLVAKKFNGSKKRTCPGRPSVDGPSEQLIVRVATDNRDWGYDRIAGALAHLGYAVSDQTVGNILKRHGIPPAPARKHTTTWKDFIRAHQEVLAATDFFTTEV